MSNQRIFIIGLDGATFDLIKPLISQGRLPTMSSLMENGAFGELTSTIHPLTATAWTSFMTGKNPGKHGVFDFISRVPGSYAVRLVNSLTRDRQTLWRILSEYGKSVGVVNVPLNYPPETVKGFIVSWMDAPGPQSQYTYPPDLASELKRALGQYLITVNFNTTLDHYREALFDLIDNRSKAVEYLMTHRTWDLFIGLFSATDFAQHAYWKYMDESHPEYDPVMGHRYGSVIAQVYEKIDAKIARMMSLLNPNDTVMVMSDHGAGPLKGVINLNRWFQTQGLLTFSRGHKASFSKLARHSLRMLKARLPMRAKEMIKQRFPDFRDQVESKLILSYLDWSRTKAFALGAYGNVWINLKGREPEGIVNPGTEYDELCRQIEEGLMQLRFGEEAVVEKVHRKEDLYQGRYLPLAPDLIIQWKDYAYHSRQRFGENEEFLFQTRQTMPMSKLEMNGFHRLNGVFIAQGRMIQPHREIKGASITDLAPTILYMMGIPVPDDMDGVILYDIFREEFIRSKPLMECHSSKTGISLQPGEDTYTPEEAEVIKKRLSSLGYLE